MLHRPTGARSVNGAARKPVLAQECERLGDLPRGSIAPEHLPRHLGARQTLARRAERKRHQQREEALHGIRKRTAPMLFPVAADEWLKPKKPTWAAKSFDVEERSLKNHLKSVFGALLLIDITSDDIADYQKSRLKEGASGKTINSKSVRCARSACSTPAGRDDRARSCPS